MVIEEAVAAPELESEEKSSSHTMPCRLRCLVVGNYCHDVLLRDSRIIGESLGGAASFISNVFDGLSLPSSYISKVGSDFAYAVSHQPIISSSSPFTTLFHAHLSPSVQSQHDRLLLRVRSSDPIHPSDLPSSPSFDFGLAVGVAGEISPETLARMVEISRIVFVDIQALIRSFDPVDGTVRMVPLRDSGFHRVLRQIGFLKASSEEAPFVDIEEARRWYCVVVTEGEYGCRIYWKDGELQIPSFPAEQIDPTGAGDSFLGGFVAGLFWGLAVPDAALLGNFFGSLTVSQIGIPKFKPKLFKKVKDALDRMRQAVGSCNKREVAADFTKSVDHENFRLCLAEAVKLQYEDPNLNEHCDLPNSMQMMGQVDKQDSRSPQKILLNSLCQVIQPEADHDLSGTINLRNSHH